MSIQSRALPCLRRDRLSKVFLTGGICFLANFSSHAKKYVFEGFDYPSSGELGLWDPGVGYGLIGVWKPDPFDNQAINLYSVTAGSLSGIGSLPSNHLERRQRGASATIWRKLAQPIGTPGTTKYLGCLMRIPASNQLTPTGIHFGIELRGPRTRAFMGGVNSVGPKFMITDFLNGGGWAINDQNIVGGKTYFCVLKLEFGDNATTCSLFIDGEERPFRKQIPAGTMDTLSVISNFTFSIDEIRLADTLEELTQIPATPQPRLEQKTVSTTEGNNGLIDFTTSVRLSSASEYDTFASFATVTDSATQTDFEEAQGQLHFQPGETEKSITVKIKGDLEFEQDEQFGISFKDFAGIHDTLFWPSTIIIAIRNDDTARVEVPIGIFPFEGNYVLNWNPRDPGLVLQQSEDLVNWQPVSPIVRSNHEGLFQVETTGSGKFYKFTPE